MEILSSNKQAFVDIMMAEELGIPPGAISDTPWKQGLVLLLFAYLTFLQINFGSFIGFDIVPLIAFMISLGANLTGNQAFGFSIGVTALTLIIMGVIQAFYCLKQK